MRVKRVIMLPMKEAVIVLPMKEAIGGKQATSVGGIDANMFGGATLGTIYNISLPSIYKSMNLQSKHSLIDERECIIYPTNN